MEAKRKLRSNEEDRAGNCASAQLGFEGSIDYGRSKKRGKRGTLERRVGSVDRIGEAVTLSKDDGRKENAEDLGDVAAATGEGDTAAIESKHMDTSKQLTRIGTRFCAARSLSRNSSHCKLLSSALPTFQTSSPVRLCPTRRSLAVHAEMNEEAAAAAAASKGDPVGPTIFDKIISKDIPASIVYEDDKVLAFNDINPQAPVHIILIPKTPAGLTRLAKAEESHKDILGHLLYASKLVAKSEGLAEGFRVVINDGPDGCQSVYHLHLHILGGRKLKWPPG